MRPRPASKGNPCLEHACSKCCWEAEVPVTQADVARLEALGHRAADFTVLDDEAVLQLAVRDGHCVFLGPDGRCSVYAHRPEGCRLYPLVWDRDAGRVVVDDFFCPFVEELPVAPDGPERLERVLATVRTEAAQRKAYRTVPRAEASGRGKHVPGTRGEP